MNNSKYSDLLPCPFCGSAGRHVPNDYVRDDLNSWHVVECTDQQCGAWVPVESWNKRVPNMFGGESMVSAEDGYTDGVEYSCARIDPDE